MARSNSQGLDIWPHVRWAFFVGPDKSGSSWIHELCWSDSRIATPLVKDLFFFDRYYHRGEEWYYAQFPVTAESEVCVEVCHDYLFSRAAAARIHAAFPEAQLVVCLRDPIARAISAYHYLKRQGRIRKQSFSQALRSIPELLEHARYGHYIGNYLEHFSLDQLTILNFDCLARSPENFAAEFLDGIGLEPPDHLPPRLLEPVRPAAEPRHYASAFWGKRFAVWLREHQREGLLSHLKRSTVIERLLFRRLDADQKVRATPEDIEYVRIVLAEDVRTLDRALGTNFGEAWGMYCE